MSAVLGPGLGCPVWKKHGYIDVSPRKGHKNDETLEHLSYEERLRGLRLLSLEKGKLRGSLSTCVNTWWEKIRKEHWGFSQLCLETDRTRGNGYPENERIQIGTKKMLFGITRDVRHRNKWTGEIVESPSVVILKAVCMWSWIIHSRWPCLSMELNMMTSRGPFQPKWSCGRLSLNSLRWMIKMLYINLQAFWQNVRVEIFLPLKKNDCIC